MITNKTKLSDLEKLTINQIAILIKNNWKNVNYAAKPYLEAMYLLDKITDNYILDSGKEIVLRFLCNAGSWRGDVARDIKAELNKRCK